MRYVAVNWSNVAKEAAAERIAQLLAEPCTFESLSRRQVLACTGHPERARNCEPTCRERRPSVIAFQGGLGNQMFQYAAALDWARRQHAVLRGDESLYRTHPEALERRYWLHHFCADVQHASADKLQSVSNHEHVEDLTRFDNFLFAGGGDVRLTGYWQSELYFADVGAEVRKSLQLRSKAVRDCGRANVQSVRRRGRPVIAVHVRRGDFVANPHTFGALSSAFYTRAASWFPAGSTFIVSSDNTSELDWCR